MSKARVIAFYLPQYHPFKENDEWWGKGFTEWTNVAKARPLFIGHYQPKIPADLGFYDLRVPEVREEQARLAREAGIEGFCYWHYWFSGHELMERPFWEVVESGKPNFPFCIGWANETWKSKLWNKDGSLAEGTKVLIEQTYSEADDIAHFYRMLPAFRDRRYICVDGKPLVFIHQGEDLPEHTIRIWNRLAKENGLNGIHFVGRIKTAKNSEEKKAILINKGFDAVTVARLGTSSLKETIFDKIVRKSWQFFRYYGCCHLISYKKELKTLCDPLFDSSEDVYPGLYPNWDHSPRSGRNGFIIIGSTPELFKIHVEQVLNTVSGKQEEHRIVFAKSWNEWGEGNYLEPDQKFGKGYLEVLAHFLTKG
jgi:lipopolysaccharide biosynthesis protein